MKYRIVQKIPMTMMGISLRTSNCHSNEIISKFWNRFYKDEVFDKIPNKCSPDVMGLYTDYEKDHTGLYSLIIGCQVSHVHKIPEGIVAKNIPASTYAVYTAKGDFPQSLIETWETIWQSELPRSYSADFEIYGKRFEEGEVDIYIAVNL